MEKPRIFVSSTVLDMEDLRGAIKFFMEGYGFEVQMSEYPNFDIDVDSSKIDACLKNISRCQYFILMIGYRRGTWYEKGKLSITHKEFRTAKALMEAGAPIRILAFVRRPIWLLKNDREGLIAHFESVSATIAKEISVAPTSVVDDPSYIFTFIDEVNSGIIPPGMDSPVNDWIFDFDVFEDIAIALRSSLGLNTDLEEKRSKALLLDELRENKARFGIYFAKLGTGEVESNPQIKGSELEYFREVFTERFKESYSDYLVSKKPFILTKDEILNVFYRVTFSLRQAGLWQLRTRVLEDMITQGTFLRYDVDAQAFQHTLLSFALKKLYEFLISFEAVLKSEIFEKFQHELTGLASDGSMKLDSVSLSVTSMVSIAVLAFYSQIPELIESIINDLTGEDVNSLSRFDFDRKFFSFE